MTKVTLNRRRFALAAAAFAASAAVPVRAQHKGPFMADMHSHYGMFMPRFFGFDLARHIAETGTTLLAWSVTDDSHWIGRSNGRLTQFSLASAKKIAARGGAVGLWTVRVHGDPQYTVTSVRSFADEMMRMCDLVGPDHVAFGTDMEGAGPGPILSDYADLRDVADNLARRGLPDETLHNVFIGNYARIVKLAMNGATP